MIVAADHVADLHVGVIDRDGEVVEDRSVAARDHRIVLEPVLEADLAPDQILDDGLPRVGDAQSNRGARPVGRGATVAGAAVRLPVRPDLLGGRGIGIGETVAEQPVDALGVTFGALVLAQRPLVPVELQPLEGVEDLGDVLAGRPLTIGVLDAKHQRTAPSARYQPVIECRPGAADVQRPGWRRGKSDSEGLFNHADRRACFHSRRALPPQCLS